MLCGNGKIDEIRTKKGGLIRIEECDGVLGCNEECYCEKGYIKDPNGNNQCIEEDNKIFGFIGIVIGSIIMVILVIIIITIFVYKIMTTKVEDITFYRMQQPKYYYYINGSTQANLEKKDGFSIEPTELHFGNSQNAPNIEETRYQHIEVKNKRNKWMMVIVHTPNNPKYVYHFEKQVLYLRPKSREFITCYMTLHCTTKLRI